MPDSKKELYEWIKSILLAVLLALLIRSFVVEVFMVQGLSMEPTLHDRERLIVSKLQYNLREPKRGEIVVFKATERRDFIKRIIAVAGDEVLIDETGVHVNGELLEEPYINVHSYDPYGPETVPAGAVFVMGDNRNNSMDSRHPAVGFVTMEKIKGKAILVFWPLKQMRVISH